MTPTLYGRWQTRILLLATVGFMISIFLGWQYDTYEYSVLIILLLYVMGFGVAWDIVYDYIQTFRWDHDWPPMYQLFAGVWEAAFLWGLIQWKQFWEFAGFTGLPGVPDELTFGQFIFHYSWVWFFTFLMTQGPMRILSPRWRYRGGEWL
ncbi:MAG: hypothetical protein AAF639_44755 [Chloroflexota bacterium]